MSDVIPPEDPFGDRAWQAQQRKKAGRLAIEEAQIFMPPPPEAADDGSGGGEDDPPGEAEPDGKPERPRYTVPRILRIAEDGQLKWSVNQLPEDSPVTPLGHQGMIYWYLNPDGELIAMESGKFGLQHIKGLFGRHQLYLQKNWPSISKNNGWTGFKAELAADALIVAAADKGIFDAREKVRGLGCWKADDGTLIVHLGDRVLIDGREERPGEIGGFVYPGRPKLLGPKHGGRADCEAIYADIRTWRWSRGELDARLFLGWMACSMLGPALDWRPHVFWIGDAGTGKSSLQDRLKGWMQGWIVSTIDASPAALRQIINQDGVGVAFDEIEADMLTDQAQQVMKLARVAASGGKVYRGGADHKAAEFLLRGCFGFSAILAPSMRQQDMQRFAFLRLLPLERGAKLKDYSPAQLRDMGAGVVGRCIEGWSRWRQTLDLYSEGLQRAGHNHRGSMQFGSLLAAADLLLGDEPPDSDTVDLWCSQLQRDGLFEYEHAEPTWLTAWRRLLSAQPEAWRQHGFPTVAQTVQKWRAAWDAKRSGNSTEGLGDPLTYQDRLVKAGLAMMVDQRGRPWLAIPPRGRAVSQIFADTDMRANGGDGVWTGALRGAPKFQHGDGVWKSDNVRALQGLKCTLYRLDAVVEVNSERMPIFEADELEPQETSASYDREPGEDG